MKSFSLAVLFLGQLALTMAQSACDCNSTACLNGGIFVIGDTLTCKCSPPFSGTRCQNGCNIQLQSYGLVDAQVNNANDFKGYVIVNGKTILATLFGSTYSRGVFVFAMDSLTCAVQGGVRAFDPHGDGNAATNFNNFVNGQPDGTLLVAVTGDEPYNNFGGAVSTIKDLGGPDISAANLDYRGKFAFVVQKGYPANGQGKVAKSGGAHLNLNVNVSGTTQAGLTITPA